MYPHDRMREFGALQNVPQPDVDKSRYEGLARLPFLLWRALRSLTKGLYDQRAEPSRSLGPIPQGHAQQQRMPQSTELVCSQPLSATIVSSRYEIARLAPFVGSLLAEPAMLDPRFFLASILGRKWRPCVCVVSQGERVAGLVYFKEPLVAGIGTRIAFGDDSLGSMLVARPEETESVVRCALKGVLKHMIAVRLLVRSDRLQLLRRVEEKAAFGTCQAKRHAHLKLHRTYDEFLSKLGPRTRRNFRYYRRKSELTGHKFAPELSFSNFCAAAEHLFPKSAYAEIDPDLQKSLAMVEATPSRITVGLRTNDGEWISLVGGWRVDDCAIINMQLNDRTRVRESLSLVLRSYLIEMLIKQGCREVVFWAGSSEPLSLYCTSPELFLTYINDGSLPWKLFRLACARVSAVSPAAFGRRLSWIVPAAK